MKVLITGADGFIGSAMMRYLTLTKLHDAVGLVRPKKKFFPELPLEYRFFDFLCADNDMPNLKDIDVVVHTAAMVHRTKNFPKNVLEGFMKMNCNATLNLAEHAAKAGVKRFIFLSSIKVMERNLI